jgi:chemosensory pili system protein ChpA (sensor histidine kinase/response regulator)
VSDIPHVDEALSATLDVCRAYAGTPALAHHEAGELCQSLAEAAAQAGWLGLGDACGLLAEALERSSPQADLTAGLMHEWLDAVATYLATPSDRAAAERITTLLANPICPVAVTGEDLEILAGVLEVAAHADVGPKPADAQHQPADDAPGDDAPGDDSPGDDSPGVDSLGVDSLGVDSLGVDLLGDLASGDLAPDHAVTLDIEPVAHDTGHPEAVPAAAASPAVETARGEIPPALGELLALLAHELDPLFQLVRATLAPALENPGSPVPAEAAEHVAEQVECFGAAAEAAGLSGLHEVCMQLAHGWHTAHAADDATPRAQCLHQAHEALAGWFGAPFTTSAAQALIDCLRSPRWPEPILPACAQSLRQALCDPGAVPELTDEANARPVDASAELVSLALPDDVPAELLDTLLEEMPLLTEQFAGAIERILRAGSLEDINVAQRAAHTLKGAANTVGVAGIANLTHQVEDVLRAFHEAGAVPGAVVAHDLVRVSDCLEGMSEAVAGQGPAPDDAVDVLQRVLDCANRIDADGGIDGLTRDEIDEPRAARLAAETAHEESARAPAKASSGTSAAATPREHPEHREHREHREAEVSPTLRVPGIVVDDLMRLTGETIILTGQVQERVQQTLRQALSMREQFALLQQLGYELEQLIDLGSVPLPSGRAGNDPYFDPLEMDEYSELHTLSRRMVEAATDAREMGRLVERQVHELISMLADQGQLNRESHERVLETRMIPAKTIVPRLQRAARQAARLTDKEIELEVTGADTRMDSDVLTEMVDPLMHVLRNAVDHGIEPAEQRRRLGKPAAGRVSLSFSRAGNQVLVDCRDDGGGLDLEAIRAAAVARGRLPADRPVADDVLRRIITEPNFSTRDSATQVSGRGIGLDAVSSKVLSLGGSFEIRSEANAGCAVELALPLTLISAHALLVRVRAHVFALSSRGVEQILHADSGTLRRVGNGLSYQVGEALHRAVLLDSLLTLPRDSRAETREPRTAILIQSEDGPVAVMVQEVIDSRDLVVKSLGRYVPKARGIIGATILGDGGVTPVLDLPELLRAPAQGRVPGTDNADPEQPAYATWTPTALVVDDSLSARRSLARVMGDSGYQVRTARDGVEAVGILDGVQPDVMLVDLEMPRMNGLELVAHLRGRADAPRIPVIMITSRSTPKHRAQAEAAGVDVYLTKPFSEDELLGHVEALRRPA